MPLEVRTCRPCKLGKAEDTLCCRRKSRLQASNCQWTASCLRKSSANSSACSRSRRLLMAQYQLRFACSFPCNPKRHHALHLVLSGALHPVHCKMYRPQGCRCCCAQCCAYNPTTQSLPRIFQQLFMSFKIEVYITEQQQSPSNCIIIR